MDQPSPVRLIIPAPSRQRRDTGVTWYEASLDTREGIARLQAYAEKDSNLGEAEVRLRADESFSARIHEGDVEIAIDARVVRVDASVKIVGDLNGQPFEIAEVDGEAAATVRPTLTESQRGVIESWGDLAEPTEALAQATRQSWGVASCSLLYLGVGFSAAACVEGAIPACGGALVGGALAIENCHPFGIGL